jgi:hypothetical protein
LDTCAVGDAVGYTIPRDGLDTALVVHDISIFQDRVLEDVVFVFGPSSFMNVGTK